MRKRQKAKNNEKNLRLIWSTKTLVASWFHFEFTNEANCRKHLREEWKLTKN